ncbi:MAG: hypothetical protein V1492_01420 [Candidatus Micrarchaeota archaeon]
MEKTDIYNDLVKCGVSDLDAKIILDCVVRKTSCSWMNNDEIKDDTQQKLNDYLKPHNLTVNIDYRANSNKYIWDVKLKR